MMYATGDTLSARAYNKGSDARLAGAMLESNPYEAGTTLAASWRQGWQDVHERWGCAVCGRWRVDPLPPIEYPSAILPSTIIRNGDGECPK